MRRRERRRRLGSTAGRAELKSAQIGARCRPLLGEAFIDSRWTSPRSRTPGASAYAPTSPLSEIHRCRNGSDRQERHRRAAGNFGAGPEEFRAWIAVHEDRASDPAPDPSDCLQFVLLFGAAPRSCLRP